MTLNCIASKSIPNGTKFVAILSDGSGAALFWIDDAGHIYDDEDKIMDVAPDTYLMDRGYAYWMKLPDKFKLWFDKGEDEK